MDQSMVRHAPNRHEGRLLMPPVPGNERDLSDRSRFLADADALISYTQGAGRHLAVLVVKAATPNQYNELTRGVGQAAADRFEELFAKSIGECLPEHTEVYTLSNTRF